MFEKLKLKKELKKKKEALSKFVKDHDAYWLYIKGSYVPLDAMSLEGIKKFSNDEDLIDAIKNCHIYKDIKSFSKPGDEPGEEYIRYYEEKCRLGQYPNDDFDGYEQFSDYKGNPQALYYPYDKAKVIDAVFFALIADNEFWCEKADSTLGETASYPILYRATRKLGDIAHILTWPMNKDLRSFINGTSGYKEFCRALLKAYKLHGQSPYWDETMRRLAYPEFYDEEEKKRFDTVSVLCARFPDLEKNLKPYDCSWYNGDTYNYGEFLMPYAPLIEQKVEQYILFNDEYWNSGASGTKFQETWDYYGFLNQEAWNEALKVKERIRNKEKEQEELS